jgi:UrcA family protein
MTTKIKSQSKSITSVIAASLVVLSWAACSPQALAADDTVIGVKKVNYGDLNLDTEAGARVLYRRLRQAASELCTSIENMDAVLRATWSTCYHNAMNSAVASVNKPRVTALHSQLSRIGTG